MRATEKAAQAAFIEGAVSLLRRALSERLGARVVVDPSGDGTVASLFDLDGNELLTQRLWGVQLSLPLAAAQVSPAVEAPATKPCVHTWERIEGENGDHWYSCVWCDTAVIEGHADYAAIDTRHRRNVLFERTPEAPVTSDPAPYHVEVGDILTIGNHRVEVMGVDAEAFVWRTTTDDPLERDEGETAWADVERIDDKGCVVLKAAPIEAPAKQAAQPPATSDEPDESYGTPNAWGGSWRRLHAYTRPDGVTVAIERDGSYRRITVMSSTGEHLVQPHELLQGDSGRGMFIRHAAEPVNLDKAVRNEVKVACSKMRGLKRVEREAVDNLIEQGRARALASMLDSFDSRKGGELAKAAGALVKSVAEAAEASLPPDVLAALNEVAPVRSKAKSVTQADVDAEHVAIRTIVESSPPEVVVTTVDVAGLRDGRDFSAVPEHVRDLAPLAEPGWCCVVAQDATRPGETQASLCPDLDTARSKRDQLIKDDKGANSLDRIVLFNDEGEFLSEESWFHNAPTSEALAQHPEARLFRVSTLVPNAFANAQEWASGAGLCWYGPTYQRISPAEIALGEVWVRWHNENSEAVAIVPRNMVLFIERRASEKLSSGLARATLRIEPWTATEDDSALRVGSVVSVGDVDWRVFILSHETVSLTRDPDEIAECAIEDIAPTGTGRWWLAGSLRKTKPQKTMKRAKGGAS